MGPYGVHGDIKVKSFSGETEHLLGLNGKMVLLRKDGKDQKRSVETVKTYGNDLLIRFVGLGSPELVHPLVASELWVEREFASPVGAGDYYIGDLVGCSLVFAGTALGTVTGLWENGAMDMFEVEKADGSKAHVPFSAQFIGEVDIASKSIQLLHDWILS